MNAIAASLSAVTAALAIAALVGALPNRLGTMRRHRSPSRLEIALRHAGVTTSVRRFSILTVASGIGVFGLIHMLTGVAPVALAPAAFSMLLPRWWVTRRAAVRRQAVQQAWPDAIRDLVASVGAGMSLNRGLEELATSGPAALRPTFSQYASVSRALGVVSALEGVRADLADATSDRVIEVLVVAHERGGAIVPKILRDLATAATQDLWVADEIETESLEQRINARAVFALPWLVLLAVTMQDGPFRDFYRTSGGVVVIAVGALASAVGIALVSRLGNQPVEPRVLVADR